MNQLSFLAADGSLDQARLARDDGMKRALDHAEEETPAWGELALAFLRCYAQKEPAFAAYMVVMASENDGAFPIPPNSRAWGTVFRAAAKARIIENSGTTVEHPKRHACPAIVWRSLIFGRPA